MEICPQGWWVGDSGGDSGVLQYPANEEIRGFPAIRLPRKNAMLYNSLHEITPYHSGLCVFQARVTSKATVFEV